MFSNLFPTKLIFKLLLIKRQHLRFQNPGFQALQQSIHELSPKNITKQILSYYFFCRLCDINQILFIFIESVSFRVIKEVPRVFPFQ